MGMAATVAVPRFSVQSYSFLFIIANHTAVSSVLKSIRHYILILAEGK